MYSDCPLLLLRLSVYSECPLVVLWLCVYSECPLIVLWLWVYSEYPLVLLWLCVLYSECSFALWWLCVLWMCACITRVFLSLCLRTCESSRYLWRYALTPVITPNGNWRIVCLKNKLYTTILGVNVRYLCAQRWKSFNSFVFEQWVLIFYENQLNGTPTCLCLQQIFGHGIEATNSERNSSQVHL